MKNWQTNNLHVRQSVTRNYELQQRRLLRRWLQIAFVLTLIALSVLLSGCATRLPVPCAPLPPISKPVPDRSLPSVSYSLQVQTFLEASQQKLTNGLSKP